MVIIHKMSGYKQKHYFAIEKNINQRIRNNKEF